MKLLIVDDSLMIRKAIESAYQGSVFDEIHTAGDGAEAVSLFKEVRPNVVTLDITMPHMDGLAAMSQMLEEDPGANILIVSALADHHTAIEALSRGAHQFICKPFTKLDLKEALDELMENYVESSVEIKADSKKALKNTVAQRVKVSDKAPSMPSFQDYPSGYVAPVSVSNVSQKPKKTTASVERQMSIAQIRKELQNEK